jgi:hypothetical protein
MSLARSNWIPRRDGANHIDSGIHAWTRLPVSTLTSLQVPTSYECVYGDAGTATPAIGRLWNGLKQKTEMH